MDEERRSRGTRTVAAWLLLLGLVAASATANTTTDVPELLSVDVTSQSHSRQDGGPMDEQQDGGADFHQRLHREAQRVSGQHQLPLPILNPPGIMHEYVTNTGAGNRQVTRISDVVEQRIFITQLDEILSWDTVRFNQLDYILATTIHGCTLWQLNPDWTLNPEYVGSLDLRDPSAQILSQQGTVTRCKFHTIRTGDKDTLLFSLVTRDISGISLETFEIIKGKPLRISRRSLSGAVRLSYLSSATHDYVVAILEGEYSCSFRTSSSFRARHLEVSLPNSVSDTSFSVDGIGYFVLANTTASYIIQNIENQMDIFDRIYMDGITSVESFEHHASTYILMSSVNVQRLFLWHPDRLLFIQQLSIQDVNSVSFVHHGNWKQDLFMVVTGRVTHTRIFIWDGEKFDQENGVVLSFVLFAPNSLSYLERGKDLMILGAEGGRARALIVRTSSLPLPDPEIKKGTGTMDQMKAAEAMLQEQEVASSRSWQVLHQAVQPGFGPVVFEARQELIGLKVSELVELDFFLVEEPLVEWEGSPLTTDDRQWSLEELERMVEDLENTLSAMESRTTDVVLLNESSSVSGHKTIMGSISSPAAIVGSLSLQQAGQRSVEEALNTLVNLDETVTILGKKIIKGSVLVTGDAGLSRVNDVSFSKEVLLTSEPQHITGHWTFETPLLVDGNVKLDGRLNNISVSEELISLHTPSFVQSTKTFLEEVRVLDSLTTSHLDGVQLEPLYHNSLTRTHSQVIHVLPPVLLEVISNKISHLTVTGLVNGLDMNAFERNLARVDRPMAITGIKTLVEPNLEGGIVVLGAYDNVHLPHDIFQPQVEQQIAGRKHFEHVRVKNSFVQGLVDGLSLESDVVRLTGTQEIFEKVFSAGVTLEGDLIYQQTIDGVTEEDLKAIVTEPKNGTEFNAVLLQASVVEKNLVIQNVIGIDLEAIERDLVFPDDRDIAFTGKKSFVELKVPRIELLKSINGYDIRKDFVTTNTDQIVKGTKTFNRAVIFESHLETGNVDGVDLSGLANDYVSLSGVKKEFQGTLTSTKLLHVQGDLKVAGRVNGMDLSLQLVLTHNTHIALANKVFAGGLTLEGHLDVAQGELTIKHLDGVDLDQFFQRRVTLTTDQTLDRSLVVNASSVSEMDVPVANRVNLQQFAADLMTLSTTQLVTGKKSFTGPALISGVVRSLEGINGFDIEDFASRAIRLDSPLSFDHRMTFESDLQILGNLNVRGLVGGVDLDDLSARSLRKSSELVLTGHNTFLSGLEVKGDLTVHSVNGRVVADRILLNHGDQIIEGVYTLSTVKTPSMTLTGHLNEIDLSELNSQTAKTNLPSIFVSNLALSHDLVVLEGTKVLGRVAGLSLEMLARNAVMKGTHVVKGTKVFSNDVVLLQNANVERINDVIFADYLHDLVYIDQDQELKILSEKRFENGFVSSSGLRALAETEVQGRVDGVKLELLVQNAIFIDQPTLLTGDVYIVNNSAVHVLTTTGLVNEVALQKEVLLLNSHDLQTITGTKTFSKVSLETSMDVTGTVNGYRLPDLVQDTLLLHSTQSVIGRKTLTGLTTVVQHHFGLVNQVDLSRQVYVLKDDMEFHENVVFDQNVVLEREVNLAGLVNDVNLTVLREEALTTTGDQEIAAPFVISQVLSTDILVDGHVSGIDMDKLQREVTDSHTGHGQEVAKIGVMVDEMMKEVAVFDAVVNGAVGSMDGLVLVQTLNVSGWVLEASPDSVIFVDPLDPLRHLHFWTWSHGELRPDRIRQIDEQHERVQFILQSTMDGNLPSLALVSLAAKYHSATFILNGVKVDATVGQDQVLFTRTFGDDSHTIAITVPFPKATGVRLFSTEDQVFILVSTAAAGVCQPGKVHLLKWPDQEPEPLFVQDFLGGDIEFGIFELEGLQYLLLAGRDDGMKGHSIKVYWRQCSCADGLFSMLAESASPGLVGVDLFSVNGGVYLVSINRTSLQIHRFQGLGGFQPSLSVPLMHALNVRTVVVQDHLHLVVGQAPRLAPNLLFKIYWNGPGVLSPSFTRWL